MEPLSKVIRVCAWCGGTFWGSARARFDSSSCRGRYRRANLAHRGAPVLAAACQEILDRRDACSASYSKLIPRVFRAAAAELQRRGWDPIELLISHPDDPAADPDTAPGGIEGEGMQRRKWLYPPEEEALKLRGAIRMRSKKGQSVAWHQARLQTLEKALAARGD
jgi:hypothetical protein